MRHISKTISLEQMKSKTPSIIPALDINKENHILTFTLDEIQTNLSKCNGNYDMFPSDVQIPDDIANEITAPTSININIPNFNDGDKYEKLSVNYETFYITSSKGTHKYLTYNDLKKWYNFFVSYNDLISGATSLRTYSSAEEYYEYESRFGDVKNKSIEYFQDMDKLYIARGGKKMFGWLNNVMFQRFLIPMEYQERWKIKYLSVPEVAKWISWFIERDKKYKYLTLEDVKGSDDCCDYIEYIERGGNEMTKLLKSFHRQCKKNYSQVVSAATCSSVINIPILMLNTIDEMGEYSIFSNEWYGDVDYGNYGENGRKSGTVVTYGEDVYIITNPKQTSYNIDEKYKEYKFDKSLKPYIDLYQAEYTVSADSYSYKDGNIKLWEHDERKDYVMADKFTINKDSNFYKIDGEIYSSFLQYYVIYQNKIYYANLLDGRIPYISYKKQTLIGEYIDGEYYINFPKINYGKKCQEYDAVKVERNYAINYKDNIILENEDNSITITKSLIPHTYEAFDALSSVFLLKKIDGQYRISKYAYKPEYDKYGYTIISVNYVIEQDDEMCGVYLNEDNNEISHYFIKDNTLYIVKPYSVYDLKYITGKTESKLNLIGRTDYSYDDIGNQLGGFFNASYLDKQRPFEGDYLDIPYQVGNVSDLTLIVDNRYVGNIITKIEFYYQLGEEKKLLTQGDYGSNDYALESMRISGENYSEIYCDVYYNIHADIELNEGIYSLSENGYKGVEMKDTFILTPKIGKYYVNSSIWYYIHYYDIEYLDVNYYNFNNSTNIFSAKMSTFKFERIDNKEKYIAAPLIRDEYKFGTTTPQKVKENIYINRGISSAFDKHLKLMEVNSFDALETYNNGYFNINEN